MSSKKFALYGGVIMFIMGLVSIFPGLEGSKEGLPELRLDTSYGLFLGLFPMNILNKVALMTFGIAGIATGRIVDSAYAIHYSRIVFFVMGLAALLGVYDTTDTLFGFWPLYGGEIIAHGIFAVLGGICGFIPSHETKQEISI